MSVEQSFHSFSEFSDLVARFGRLASKYLKPSAVTKLGEAIFSLEDVEDVGTMMDLVRTF